MKKIDTTLLDHLGKVFLIHDNFSNILSLADDNFTILKDSLKINSNYPNNPTREQLVAEKNTAMLFQLSVGYLYNLIEVIKFLKNNHHCDDLFESNVEYYEFEINNRLICELRNNIILHGKIKEKSFRGIQQILTDLKISRDECIKNIWIALRCGLEFTNQILYKFQYMRIEKNIISENMYSDEDINIIENYFDAKNKFHELSK